MSIRAVVIKLVESDTAPSLLVRFPDMDLSEYSLIEMHIAYDTGKRTSLTATPVGSADIELLEVVWTAGALIRGTHRAEFEFTQISDSKTFTLPQPDPITLSVRKETR